MPHALLRIGLMVLGVVSIAGAAPPPYRNAAARYERAFEHMSALTNDDWQVIYEYSSNPAAPKPPGLARIGARVQRAVDEAMRGSRFPTSVYDLDFEQGFDMLLPHLSPMRSLSHLMRHDVIVRLHEGDIRGATERLAAMYRMSRHPSDDGILISSLVGMAMFDLADKTVEIAMAQGMLSEREYGILLDATETLEGDDPFQVMHAIEGERELGASSLRRFAPRESREDLLDAFGWAGAQEELAGLIDLSEDEFRAEVGFYDATLAQIEDAFVDPDRVAARAKLDEVEKRIESGEVGPLVHLLLPAFGKMFDRMLAIQERLATRRVQLQDLALGRRNLRDLVNAAYLYQRATEAIAGLDADMLAALRARARGEKTEDAVVRRGLEAAAPILALLDDASRYERCDFSVVRPEWSEGRLFATPIVGMADAGALLIAAAVTPAGSPDRSDVPSADPARHLATCLRMAGHLAGDDALLSSLLSHALFTRAVDVAATRADRAQALSLVEATKRLRREDPFGYRGSLTAAKAAAYRWVAQRVTPPDQPAVPLAAAGSSPTTRPAADPDAAEDAERERERIAAFWARLEEKVAALDDDEIFCLLAVREQRAVASPPGPFEWVLRPFPGDPLAPLAGVVERAPYEEIAARAEAIEALVAADAMTILFASEPAPTPARVVRRAERASSDLSQGRERLRQMADETSAQRAATSPGDPSR